MPRTPFFPAWLRFAALFAALLCAVPAVARIAGKDDPVTLQQTWNPRPDALDIVLPMPCGLSMAFRAVAVPGEPGQEFPFMMGLQNADRERRIYGERREGRIAGVFTGGDLPIAWRTLLEKSEWQNHTVYLMGKYEVSQAQWDAVMGECPVLTGTETTDKLPDKKRARSVSGANLPAAAALPVREISWAEMQTFLGKYNGWLQKQPHALPRFVDNPKETGSVRLPTEAEWEFAARGGLAVDKEERESDFFLHGRKLEDYAVFAGERPEPIGSRQPNALGLYDTAGNVKELMDDAFRSGGSTGDVVAKGGGFRSGKDGVLPGWRDEAKRYNSPNDQGFRLVLTGPLTASARRMAALNARDDVEKRGEAVEQLRAEREQRIAAEEEARQAKLELARMRQETAGGSGKSEKKTCRELNDVEALYDLGEKRYAGLGMPQDYQQAAECWRKAADQGHATAQFNLGVMYESGQGVSTDERQAAAWYRKAAEQGHPGAQNNLGNMYRHGKGGLPQNMRQAVSWYHKAAEQGLVDSQIVLGGLYGKGLGVPRDDAQAVFWFRKAAEQGDAEAQHLLALLYQSGRGVPKDDAQAVAWFRKAAEQGHAGAQHNLATAYSLGWGGLPKDMRQAAAWYRKAAAQGDRQAREALRRLGQ